jgi:hypothetical protein
MAVSNESFSREWELNRQAYESMRDQIRKDYAGKYVAMAFGQIVKVCADYREACAAVDTMQPPPEHTLVFRGDDEPGLEIIEHDYRELI